MQPRMQSRALLNAAAALSVATGGAAFALDAQTVVRDAAKAIGADTLKTVQYSASGFDYAVGQQANPNLPWPKFITKQYTRSIDFDTAGSRVERVRAQGENPPRGGGGQPIAGEQKQTQIVYAKPDSQWTQQAELWVTPHGFLRAALAKPATVETKKLKGKSYKVVTVQDGGNKLVGYINDANLVERVETWIDNSVLGDTLYESTYTDYRDAGGAKFPYRIEQKQGGYPVYELTVNDVKVNSPVTVGDAPAQNQQPALESEKLGDGVYLIKGGYSIIAVDFKDHIVLFESGNTDARAQAAITEAKKLIPGKPIKYVVNTHPHFDHAGGLRAFVAEGATILTHNVSKSYLEKTLAQPRTAGPQPKGKPKVEGVGDKKVLTDGNRVVELYRLQNFGHHDGTLVAYFPKEKVLFQADAYNPPAASATPPSPPNPFNTALLDNIEKLQLDIDRIVPVHYPNDNRVVTVAELRRWVSGQKLAAN